MLRDTVEQQAGLLRGLAIAMRADAEARSRWFDRRDVTLIESWAAQLDLVADALTAAASMSSRQGVRRWAKMGVFLAAPVAVLSSLGAGVGEGVGTAWFEAVFEPNSPSVECAVRVVETGQAVLALAETEGEAELGVTRAHAIRDLREILLAMTIEEMANQLMARSPMDFTVSAERLSRWEDGSEIPNRTAWGLIEDVAKERLTNTQYAEWRSANLLDVDG